MDTRRSWFEQWSAPMGGSCMVCGAATGGAPVGGGGINDLRQWSYRLCRPCQGAIPWITAIGCRSCGRSIRCSDCERHPLAMHGMAGSRGVVQYDAAMKEWLSRFKFKGERGFASLIAGMMLERYAMLYGHTELGRRSSQRRKPIQVLQDFIRGSDSPRPPDVMMYVPSSRERLAERGFNQAAMVAQLLGRAWQRPVVDGLTRSDGQTRQSHQSRGGRESSLRGAYGWNRAVLRNMKRVVPYENSLRLMLIDDVYTTGNTLRACGAALREGLVEVGIEAQIWGYTWARA